MRSRARNKAESAKLTEVSPEDQLKIDDAILGLEIMAHAPKSRDKEAKAASGKIYAEMYQNGRMPTSGQALGLFFECIMFYGDQESDPVLFEVGLKKLKAKFGDNPRNAGFFATQEKRLGELKAAAEGDE